MKNVFKFNTGIAYISFAGLLVFSIPDRSSINFKKGRNDIMKLSLQDRFLF